MSVLLDDFLTLSEAASRIESKELSPVELVDAYLERIQRVNPKLHAFITITADLARSQAAVAEQEIARGRYRGPLHGIPFALKDLYFMAGVRTTAHSRVLEHWIPEDDATCVRRLYDAGAVLVGKLAMAEFATGGVTEAPWPAARNPWNLEHIPGGSSSGSGAAVAAGLCLLSLGSDTGGSIRGPASLCGCVGLRPTYGRVSRWGAAALSWSLDTCGPLTATVADCGLALNAIAGYDPKDPGSADEPVPDFSADLTADLTGLSVGVDRKHFLHADVSQEVQACVMSAMDILQQQGATVRDIELPALDYAHAAQSIIHMSESHAYHEARIRATPELYGPTLRAYFRLGALVSSTDYLQAQRVRNQIRNEMVTALRDEVDIIAAPTSATPAGRFDEGAASTRLKVERSNLTTPFSLAGVPAVSVPCGFSGEGLPIGLQLAGAPFAEATVLRCAYAYEQATPWHRRHPSL